MKNTFLILILFLSLYSCRNSYELSMERGEYFYNVGAYEEATLEYKSVINHYPSDIRVLDEKTIHMLANAHHNLAVIFLKRSTNLIGRRYAIHGLTSSCSQCSLFL